MKYTSEPKKNGMAKLMSKCDAPKNAPMRPMKMKDLVKRPAIAAARG